MAKVFQVGGFLLLLLFSQTKKKGWNVILLEDFKPRVINMIYISIYAHYAHYAHLVRVLALDVDVLPHIFLGFSVSA